MASSKIPNIWYLVLLIIILCALIQKWIFVCDSLFSTRSLLSSFSRSVRTARRCRHIIYFIYCCFVASSAVHDHVFYLMMANVFFKDHLFFTLVLVNMLISKRDMSYIMNIHKRNLIVIIYHIGTHKPN